MIMAYLFFCNLLEKRTGLDDNTTSTVEVQRWKFSGCFAREPIQSYTDSIRSLLAKYLTCLSSKIWWTAVPTLEVPSLCSEGTLASLHDLTVSNLLVSVSALSQVHSCFLFTSIAYWSSSFWPVSNSCCFSGVLRSEYPNQAISLLSKQGKESELSRSGTKTSCTPVSLTRFAWFKPQAFPFSFLFVLGLFCYWRF